jgi:hypothetical protein
VRRDDKERYRRWPRWDAFCFGRGTKVYKAARWRALTALAVTVAAGLRLRQKGAR